MNDHQTTCDRVDREGLDTRYLAGTLTGADAEAFEAHYFECDRCWALVHRGVEVRSAGRPPVAAPAVDQPRVIGLGRRWVVWLPLAAAALVVVWIKTRSSTPAGPVADSTLRGTEGARVVAVTALQSGSDLRIAWRGVSGAARYQARLFDPNGTLLWTREVTDTAAAVARDSLPGRPSGTLYWQVQALDPVGATVARSSLIEASPPQPKP